MSNLKESSCMVLHDFNVSKSAALSSLRQVIRNLTTFCINLCFSAVCKYLGARMTTPCLRSLCCLAGLSDTRKPNEACFQQSLSRSWSAALLLFKLYQLTHTKIHQSSLATIPSLCEYQRNNKEGHVERIAVENISARR